MTAIQIVALVCLPFVWMALANGPSRGAMRRMRRNARRGGVPEDVAFDRWIRRNGRNPATVSLINAASAEDQAAFALVLSVADEIRDATRRGETAGAETRRIRAERYPQWVEQCGSAVAGRAIEMLNNCGESSFIRPEFLIRNALARR
jgi:hypothetical protein